MDEATADALPDQDAGKSVRQALRADAVPAGAQSSRDMEITSVMVPQRRHAPVPRVMTTLAAMRMRYSSISARRKSRFPRDARPAQRPLHDERRNECCISWHLTVPE